MKALENIAGWGNIFTLEDAVVYRPERFDSVKEIIPNIDKTYIGVGNLRSYGDICTNKDGSHIQMKRLNRILNFDSKTSIITAESGTTIKTITDFAISKRHLPPVVPGTGFCTLGGALANDIHGKNHELMGSFADHLVSFDLLTPDNKIRHITAENDPDIFYATIGGMGLTGVILTVSIKLIKAESATLKVRRQQKNNLSDLLSSLDSLKDDYSVAWIDAMATGNSMGRGILETAHPVGIEVPHDPVDPMKVPFFLPSFVLNKYTIKIFNNFYYNRAEVCDRETFEDFRKFSFPLDGILNWNRIYGKKGFYQFQCVIPEEDGEYILRKILKKVSASGMGSFLAVLKKLGSEGRGMLSFPQKGYTLALDFPNKKGVLSLLKVLEGITLDAGGRIYMAKDSVMSSQSFSQMYPEKHKFVDIIRKLDPKGKLSSDGAKRVGLCSQN